MRQFVSKWGSTLIFASFVITSVTGILLHFRVRASPIEELHIWIGFLMIAGAFFHVARNWRQFLGHFILPAFYAGLALTLVISGWFSYPALMSTETAAGRPADMRGPSPSARPYSSAALSDLAPLAHTDANGLMAKLSAMGITVSDPTATLHWLPDSAGKTARNWRPRFAGAARAGKGPSRRIRGRALRSGGREGGRGEERWRARMTRETVQRSRWQWGGGGSPPSLRGGRRRGADDASVGRGYAVPPGPADEPALRQGRASDHDRRGGWGGGEEGGRRGAHLLSCVCATRQEGWRLPPPRCPSGRGGGGGGWGGWDDVEGGGGGGEGRGPGLGDTLSICSARTSADRCGRWRAGGERGGRGGGGGGREGYVVESPQPMRRPCLLVIARP